MKLNVLLDESPSLEDDESAVLLLAGVSVCYAAFKSGRPPKHCPIGLECILQGKYFDEVRREISGCNRMSAGVTFRTMGPWAEIRFCKGSKLLKAMTISFVLQTQQFLIVAT